MVPPPPGGTAAPEKGAGARPPPPPQPPAPTGTAGNKRTRTNTPGRHMGRAQTASDHEPERYGGHALHDRNDASDTRFVACPGKTEGRNEAERPPAPLAPPAAQTGGAAHSPPHPPTPPHPPARERPGRADPPDGGHATPSQVGGKRDRAAPPPRYARRSKGPGQDTRRGTDGVERPYRRPAPGPREVRAPHHPGEARGGSGRRGSASAHTHKGHAGNTRRATGPSSRNAQTAWNGVPASEDKGYPDGTARHTQRGTRGAGRGKPGGHNTRYRPGPPKPAGSAAHTRTGHCSRQSSSGALRHAPTPRLGSHRASPRGSHWRQASSTGPAAPAPRATTH